MAEATKTTKPKSQLQLKRERAAAEFNAARAKSAAIKAELKEQSLKGRITAQENKLEALNKKEEEAKAHLAKIQEDIKTTNEKLDKMDEELKALTAEEPAE
jgi:chromosome segregation ATPase